MSKRPVKAKKRNAQDATRLYDVAPVRRRVEALELERLEVRRRLAALEQRGVRNLGLAILALEKRVEELQQSIGNEHRVIGAVGRSLDALEVRVAALEPGLL